jgi:HSP20 family protein
MGFTYGREELIMKFGTLMPLLGRRDPFATLQQEIDRLFESFPRGMPELASTAWKTETFAPRIEVADEKDGLKVTAELPGIDEKDIECTLDEGVLTIRGEKNVEKKEEDKAKGYYLAERAYGSFYRSIPLPYQVDRDKVEAGFDKGVLTIRLPKAAEAKSVERKIAIKSAKNDKPGDKKAA